MATVLAKETKSLAEVASNQASRVIHKNLAFAENSQSISALIEESIALNELNCEECKSLEEEEDYDLVTAPGAVDSKLKKQVEEFQKINQEKATTGFKFGSGAFKFNSVVKVEETKNSESGFGRFEFKPFVFPKIEEEAKESEDADKKPQIAETKAKDPEASESKSSKSKADSKAGSKPPTDKTVDESSFPVFMPPTQMTFAGQAVPAIKTD